MTFFTPGSLFARASLLFIALLSGVSAAPAALRYRIRFPAPHTHYAEVELVVPTGGRDSIELSMATWTPGSYLLREYARHIENLTLVRGESRSPLRKQSKNRWRATLVLTALHSTVQGFEWVSD